MSGLIGGAVRRHLDPAVYEVRSLSRRAVDGVPSHQADIADLEAIQPAFAGVDTVVHLAAAIGNPPFETVLRANVVGTYNVFEAARRAGVARVIFASSGATVSGWERVEPYRALAEGRYDGLRDWPMITHETPLRPSGAYGASKVWGEALGRHYADAHGLSVICVRIGHVSDADRPIKAREFAVWASQRDVARMIERCLAAPPTVRFDIVFVTSAQPLGLPRPRPRPRRRRLRAGGRRRGPPDVEAAQSVERRAHDGPDDRRLRTRERAPLGRRPRLGQQALHVQLHVVLVHGHHLRSFMPRPRARRAPGV
jgi:nucleoside-diphosphate-sugar epimerase